MANVKISQLPNLTTVNSDSQIPVVQGGVTYSSTVGDIVAGGNPLGSIKVIADGSIGGPRTIYVGYNAVVPQNTNGTTTMEIVGAPQIEVDANNTSNGSVFTATEVSFPDLTVVGSAGIFNSTTIVTQSYPSLTTIVSSLYIYNNPNLTTVNVPNLTYCQNVSFGSSPNYTLVFPALEYASLNVQGTTNLTGYTSAMFPALRTGGFGWGYNYLPSFTINFPLLTKLLSINGTNNVNMSTIYLPALVDIYNYMNLGSMVSLTNVTLGTLGVTKKWGNTSGNTPNVYFQNASLTQASVDNILIVMASLDGTNGTTLNGNGQIQLNGGNNASPSSAGLAAKSTLIGRGFSVSTN